MHKMYSIMSLLIVKKSGFEKKRSLINFAKDKKVGLVFLCQI